MRDSSWIGAGRLRVVLLIGMGIMLLSTACGGDRPLVAQSADLPDSGMIGWPPPVTTPHQVSDTELTLLGREWSDKGGRAYTEGDALQLLGGDGVPWGLYTIGYLSALNELDSLAVDFAWEAQQLGDGTLPFIGLANHRERRWEWYSAVASPWTFTFDHPEHYRSELGLAHVIFALAGPGQAQLEKLTVNVSGTVVPRPENLTGHSPEVGVVELDWDIVPMAAGYNVYRARDPQLTMLKQLNESPVIASDFQDTTVGLGRLHWYYVTAVAHNESDPSDTVVVWAHQIELPAPQNPRVSARGETSFTVAWDWEQLNPQDGFVIFLGTWPDFQIESETERWYANGSAREWMISGRIPGFIYYWRMCARQDGLYGRLTEELTGSTAGSWTWGDVEVIDTGWPPVRAVEADGKLAVAYVNDRSVRLAVDQGSHWRIDTPLPQGPEVITGSETYAQYLDLAHHDGTFVVAAHEANSKDAWAAWGRQYDWERKCLHGEAKSRGLAPCSGMYCEAAINADEMAVVHLDLTGEDPLDPEDSKLLVHRKPFSGGSWITQRIRYFNVEAVPSHSICYHAGQLHAITTDLFKSELYTCDSEGNWTLVDVTPPGQSGLVKHHDLHWFEGQWYTPALHYSQQELYLLTGVAPPWSDQLITLPGEDMGHEARLDIEGSEAVMIFYGYNYGWARYQFAVYSEGWTYKPIGVPHVASENYAGGADIVLMDGNPYFVFWDEGTEEIKVAKGTPPVE